MTHDCKMRQMKIPPFALVSKTFCCCFQISCLACLFLVCFFNAFSTRHVFCRLWQLLAHMVTRLPGHMTSWSLGHLVWMQQLSNNVSDLCVSSVPPYDTSHWSWSTTEEEEEEDAAAADGVKMWQMSMTDQMFRVPEEELWLTLNKWVIFLSCINIPHPSYILNLFLHIFLKKTKWVDLYWFPVSPSSFENKNHKWLFRQQILLSIYDDIVMKMCNKSSCPFEVKIRQRLFMFVVFDFQNPELLSLFR